MTAAHLMLFPGFNRILTHLDRAGFEISFLGGLQ
jgi:hypothetical protein